MKNDISPKEIKIGRFTPFMTNHPIKQEQN
jgi:hypothetical protein